MSKYKLLESYTKKSRQFNPNDLDTVTSEFKSLLVESIDSDVLLPNIQDKKTHSRVKEIISKKIKTDLNELIIPYYDILENINLCIEVKMVQEQISFEDEKKFGEIKFTEILESGLRKPKMVNKFFITESKFKNWLEDLIREYTNDIHIDHENIKILFN